MAGTVTVRAQHLPEPPTIVLRFSWLSDASGDADLITPLEYNGTISRACFIPDGAAAPTDLYDVTVLDEDGCDVLDGQGADRSATLKQAIVGFGEVMGQKLQLVVANAGNAKEGVVVLHVRRDI